MCRVVFQQVTKKNVLKDFVAVAGPLGVTHFIIFGKTSTNVNMVSSHNTGLVFFTISASLTRLSFLQRVARLPKGPTLHFRVLKVNTVMMQHDSNQDGHT